MNKDDKIYLFHMLDAVDFILEITRGIKKEDFLADRTMRDAVIRNFEIIGEAAKQVSTAFRSKHQEIHWKKIAGMRDVLIHEYFGVDYDKIWNVIAYRLPELRDQLKGMIAQ